MKIVANEISKIYKTEQAERTVVDKAYLQINGGEFHCVFGSSGAGKTTLLNVLTGMLSPEQGEVLYDETNIYNIPENKREQFRREAIGYVMQGMTLLPHITVYENIVLVSNLYKKTYSNEQLEKIMKTLSLEKISRSYPRQISGGEYRRVSLARTLLQEPEILIVDEPTCNLDLGNRDIIRKVLIDYCDKNHAVLITTHDEKFREGNYIFYQMDDGLLKKEN